MKTATKRRTARIAGPRRTRSVRATSRSAHRASSRKSAARRTISAHGRLLTATAMPGGLTRGVKASVKTRIPDPEHAMAIKNFEAAARCFQKQNYEKARELFEKLANSAPPEVADRARTYLQFCAQKLGSAAISPRTAGEYHVLGVAELNARRLDAAVEHLAKARKLEPKREDIRYALAAAHALKGQNELAIEHLQVAIALRPQNRYQARSDRDFDPLARDPRFQSLIFAESRSWNNRRT